MRQHSVFLNPDGSRPTGLLVIVSAPTGVIYRTRCGGLTNEQRQNEGFLVPCPSQDFDLTGNVESALVEFFSERFRNQGDTGDTWPQPYVEELAALIQRVVYWLTPAGGADSRMRLALHRSRLSECTEAWIPVITPEGPGILTFDNSD
jgi:hypothetical protein